MVTIASILTTAFFNCRLSLMIVYYERLFANGLPGQTLPELTKFLFEHRIPWVLTSFILPAIAVISIWTVRDHRWALGIAAVVLVLLIFQMNITSEGMISPMVNLIRGMST
jgi:hypothetical protein